VETGLFVLYTMVGIADCEMSSKTVVQRAKAENVQASSIYDGIEN
jgi:hypothetical protein